MGYGEAVTLSFEILTLKKYSASRFQDSEYFYWREK
jgi:hypothetical protein